MKNPPQDRAVVSKQDDLGFVPPFATFATKRGVSQLDCTLPRIVPLVDLLGRFYEKY